MQIFLEEAGQKQSLIILLSLTNEGNSRQIGFTKYEINLIESLALEKVHRQK